MKQYIFCLIALTLTMGSARAFATDGSAGLNQFYQLLFGTPDQENAAINNDGVHDVTQENCDGYGGVIGVVDSFFCHMEQDMGITSLGSYTNTYGNYQIHAEFTQTPLSIAGHLYAYQGEVWACNTTTSNCSQTSNYQQAYYIAFTNDPGGGVNDGYLITEPGVFSGQTGTAMQISYDVGSSQPNQYVNVQAIFQNASDTYSMWASGQKTATNVQLNLASYDSTNGGVRFALSTTPDIGDTKYFNLYFENSSGATTCSSSSNGYCSTDNSAFGISTAPATGDGLCIYSTDAGSSVADSVVSASSCGGLPFLTFSDYALTADGTPSAQALTQSTILSSPGSAWNGMPATPSSL